MTQNADIITRALRKLNAVALGATPDPSEQANALTVLRAFYSDTFDSGGYGPLIDVTVTTPTYTAAPQQRIIAAAPVTVTRPTAAAERSAIEINDGTGTRVQLVWDGAAWIELDSTSLTDPVLVPQSMVEELASYLAVVLSADYGQPASAFDTAAAQGLAKDIAAGLAAPRIVAVSGVPLVSDIIRGAAQKLIGTRAQALTSYQQQVALDALKGLFQEWAAAGVFGAMWDAAVAGAGMSGNGTTVYPGQRILATDHAQLSLPDNVPFWARQWDRRYGWSSYDWWWCYWPVWPANASYLRPPRDLSIAVVSNPDGGDSVTYLFDAQAGTWVNCTKFSLSSPCPLGQGRSEMLKAALAVRMADDLGVEPKPTTVQTARSGVSAMALRWNSVREHQPGTYF